ncbi:MAG: hypothetical protein ACRDJE_20220 [Dehalococcoidia bacterium]
MTEHTEQTPAQPSAAPARIQLEDFIEAVTRGVTRALAAQDEVSGYALQSGGFTRSVANPTILIGIIAPPPTTFPGLPDLSSSQGTLERR